MKKIFATAIIILLMFLTITFNLSTVKAQDAFQYYSVSKYFNDENFGTNGMNLGEDYFINGGQNYYYFEFLGTLPEQYNFNAFDSITIKLPRFNYNDDATALGVDIIYEDLNIPPLTTPTNYSQISFIENYDNKKTVQLDNELNYWGNSLLWYEEGTPTNRTLSLTYDINENFIQTNQGLVSTSNLRSIYIRINTDMLQDTFDSYDCFFLDGTLFDNKTTTCAYDFFTDKGWLGQVMSNLFAMRATGEGFYINYYMGLEKLGIDEVMRTDIENNTIFISNMIPDPPDETLEFFGWKNGETFINSSADITPDMQNADGMVNLQAVFLTANGSPFEYPTEIESNPVILDFLSIFKLHNTFGAVLIFVLIIIILTIIMVSFKAPQLLYLVVYLMITILWTVLGLLPVFVIILMLLLLAVMFIYITGGANYE